MAIKRTTERLAAIHPGEFLREDFMKPLSLSNNGLALALRVPATRISEIVNQRRGISTDTAFRLSQYFNTSPEFWMNMQQAYDLSLGKNELLPRIKKEVRRHGAALEMHARGK